MHVRVLGLPQHGTTTAYRRGCRCADCRAAHAAASRRRRATDQGKRVGKARDLRKTFGISMEQYDEMLRRQKGACAICKEPCATGKQLSVDHDHITGRVRALLCQGCNVGIGHFGESPERLEAAARYLRCM